MSLMTSNAGGQEAFDYEKSKSHWNTIEATMNGMLGGFTNVNTADVDESRGLLKKLFGKMSGDQLEPPLRALDCGAGIGRVTKYVLSQFFDEIDLLEQNVAFVQSAKDYIGERYSKVRNTFIQGIHEFEPLPGVNYDCIWIQWVLNYITDDDLVIFLEKCSSILKRPHGFVVIKENITRNKQPANDEEDGSCTRPEAAFNSIFDRVPSLQLKCIVRQKKLPRQLFPVKMFVLTHCDSVEGH